ncbi:hypothetical protein, partial [Streptomyces calidiresistens]|uniref:hypothetical protein n=1 Tax=Streptomyces calidiresistens TaxID=1485586 RepID=UPI0015FAFF4E
LAPPPPITLVVAHTRRLRAPAGIRLLRTRDLPRPVWIDGLPVVPVARAIADATAPGPDPAAGAPGATRSLMAAALIGGHCTARELLREVGRSRPDRRGGSLRALEGACADARAFAQDALWEVVRAVVGPPAGRDRPTGPGDDPITEPFRNVELRTSRETPGTVDAYWPREHVALVLDTRECSTGTVLPGETSQGRDVPRPTEEGETAGYTRRREALERIGVTVVHLTPRGLREAPDLQAVIVRTALTGAPDRPIGRYVAVLPN